MSPNELVATGNELALTEEWYEALIEECKAIITECEFNARWALVEGYHGLGKRILEEHDNFERAKIYGNEILQRVAKSLDKSQRTIYYAVELAQKYPDLSLLPGGKAISWRRICNELLPGPKEPTPALPDGKYRVIYADPPWQYTDGLIEGYGAAEHHYSTMTLDELSALPIGNLAADDAVLFLWATSPLLEDAFSVVRAWGFEYKTSFVWDKLKHNFGHYNSVRHEFLLVCTKGSCVPDSKTLFDSVQSIERSEHSEKPERFREIIDSLYTTGKRIELFARREVPGWEAWGNEQRVAAS